jgi:hypothetical protein
MTPAEEEQRTNVIITADQYKNTPVYELLVAAAMGRVGIDQRLLRAIVDRGESAIEDLVRFGLENRFEDRINLEEDMLAIIQFVPSPKAIPYLIDLLSQEPHDPPEDIVHAFQRVGDSAVGPLLDLYRELGPTEGGDIAFIISTFRNRDPRILKMLEERVEEDASDAAFLMGVHGDPAAKPLLQKLKADPTRSTVASEADEALQTLDQEVVEDSPEPVNLWDIYPEHIEPVFDVMPVSEKLEFLRCPSAELRADCATSFIDREVPDEVSAALLELAKNDPNVGVRAVACTALGSHADEPEVFEVLSSRLKDQSRPAAERCGALLGASAVAKQHPELKAYFHEFYANPSTTARAIEAMWRSLDAEFVDIFKRHIGDADTDIRRQAIKGIGFAEVSSEAPKLVELFKDDDLRLDALFSYAMCVPLKKLARGTMPQVLRKIEEIAGGLSDMEADAVTTALDTRLILHGLEPVFVDYSDEEHAEEEK